jgi:hypothetical protein
MSAPQASPGEQRCSGEQAGTPDAILPNSLSSDAPDEGRLGLGAAHRLHHDRREPLAMFGDDGLDLIELIEVKRVHQPCELSPHALGIEARQQVTVECGGRAEMGAEPPARPKRTMCIRSLSAGRGRWNYQGMDRRVAWTYMRI